MPLAGAGPHPPAGRRLTVAASGLMPGGRAARGPRRCRCLPARGEAGDEGVIRAVEIRMLPALAIEASL